MRISVCEIYSRLEYLLEGLPGVSAVNFLQVIQAISISTSSKDVGAASVFLLTRLTSKGRISAHLADFISSLIALILIDV